MELIRSLENSRIKLYRSLKMKKYRDRYGLFIIQEKHLIEEALRHNRLEELIRVENAENVFPVEGLIVSREIMNSLSDNQSPNDFIGIGRITEQKLQHDDRLIVLEDVQDPGNVGTIIRTASCFGYDGVLLSNKCADIYNSKTVSACQGAIFSIPVIRMDVKDIIDYLKDEGQGLTDETISSCDECFKIEMENFDSLNVAMAMAIASYHFRYGR